VKLVSIVPPLEPEAWMKSLAEPVMDGIDAWLASEQATRGAV
jgi:hypothetical protein